MNYTKDFKEKLIKEYHESNVSYDFLVKKYGVHYHTLYRWINEPKGRNKSEVTILKDRERNKISRQEQNKKGLSYKISPRLKQEFKDICALNNTTCSDVLMQYAKDFIKKNRGNNNE